MNRSPRSDLWLPAAIPSPESRRRFLQRLAAVSAITAGGGLLTACSDNSTSPTGGGDSAATDPRPAGRLVTGAVDGRVLVVVDLDGGNDGLSTVVPAGDPNYYDLRPTLAINESEVLELDGRRGLRPELARLHQRGLASVEGVGPIDGDLSHFAMVERWERGDVSGTNGLRTGFLGRLTDALDDGSPLVGLSVAGPTAHFTNDRAATLSLEDRNQFWFLQNEDWTETLAFQSGLRSLAEGRTSTHSTLMARSYEELLDLAATLPEDGDDDIDWDQPMLAAGGDLGQQLFLAADMIEADVGVRVVYASLGGFDTHDDHEWRHPQLMSQFDAAVDGFLGRMERIGQGDQVVVATVSEFGRRVTENGAGLDHGAASSMLIAGAIAAKGHGEPPPLDDLDDDDNLRVTVSFDRYLASLAEEWLGVEAASVLPGNPTPMGLFV